MASLCGLDCSQCEWGCSCKGCEATGGKPFGGSCVLAEQCRKGPTAWEAWRASLIQAFNDLHIPDMGPVTSLEALAGSYINLEYTLPGGQKVKLWDDDRVYLGYQLHKSGSERCYGLTADETYLMVAEYGEGGSEAELVVFKRWNEG